MQHWFALLVVTKLGAVETWASITESHVCWMCWDTRKGWILFLKPRPRFTNWRRLLSSWQVVRERSLLQFGPRGAITRSLIQRYDDICHLPHTPTTLACPPQWNECITPHKPFTKINLCEHHGSLLGHGGVFMYVCMACVYPYNFHVVARSHVRVVCMKSMLCFRSSLSYIFHTVCVVVLTCQSG